MAIESEPEARTVFNVHEAKTHLSKLLERAAKGERITIARAGKPLAELGPLSPRPVRRLPGMDRGLITIHPDFDDPLPEFEEYM
jgi:prevent-host-death family protein